MIPPVARLRRSPRRSRPPAASRSSRSPGCRHSCERDALLDRAQVVAAAHEGDRDQVDVLLDGEVDPVQVRLGTTAGSDASAPGRLMPWCEATGPPASTSQRASSASALEDAQPDAPVGEVDDVAGARRPPAGPATRPAAARRSPGRLLGAQHELVALLEVDHVAARCRRAAASAPAGRRAGRRPSPRARQASRIVAIRSACSSAVAWEKLIRRTSAPAAISSTSRSTVDVAGPTVATIFVRRKPGRSGCAGISALPSPGCGSGAATARSARGREAARAPRGAGSGAAATARWRARGRRRPR